jgi:hypothetical protein
MSPKARNFSNRDDEYGSWQNIDWNLGSVRFANVNCSTNCRVKEVLLGRQVPCSALARVLQCTHCSSSVDITLSLECATETVSI